MGHLHRLAPTSLLACLFALGLSPAFAKEGELPTGIRKAWQEREAQAKNVEVTFKGSVKYFLPVPPLDDFGVLPGVVPPLLPRAGKLIYSGTKIRFEETGRWPLDDPGETFHAIRFNDEHSVSITKRGKIANQAVLSKASARAAHFESCLQPLFWALRPTTSVLRQHGPRKLFVAETTLPKVDGKCYMLTEESLTKGEERVIFWIHEASATIRQVEYKYESGNEVRFVLAYERKDTPWVPSSWSRLNFQSEDVVESRSDFQIESVKLPRSIEPGTFDFTPEPGMKFVDATVNPYQIYDIDQQGQKLPVDRKAKE